MNKNNGKWYDDGDCLICNHCGKVIDYHTHEHEIDNELVEVPKYCPYCLDEKHQLGKA